MFRNQAFHLFLSRVLRNTAFQNTIASSEYIDLSDSWVWSCLVTHTGFVSNSIHWYAFPVEGEPLVELAVPERRALSSFSVALELSYTASFASSQGYTCSLYADHEVDLLNKSFADGVKHASYDLKVMLSVSDLPDGERRLEGQM